MDDLKFDQAAHSLKHGQEYPYDCDDYGKADPAKDWAHSAARGILADLNDRGGIKHSFVDIDAEVRADIVESLAEIIRKAHVAIPSLTDAEIDAEIENELNQDAMMLNLNRFARAIEKKVRGEG